ncbi:MAG: Ppx/GppA family phosphatase, partial [Pseudomonadota bacterium]
MSDSANISSPTKRAVVDIGSNSVRLVIYDGTLRAPSQICNEKALCGLGRNLKPGGALDHDAAEMALTTLKRFRRILDEHGSPHTRAIATAAVREASDGPAFVEAVNAIGFDVEIINGQREAALAAFGVLSYNPEAEGIIGDMGGGSLELVAVKQRALKDAVSLSLGPLRLMQETDGDIARADEIVERRLDDVKWIGAAPGGTLFAVGGAWRAVARIHMRLRSYPLSILHHYALPLREATDLCDLIARQSRRSLEEIPGIPRRRIDTLPFAA